MPLILTDSIGPRGLGYVQVDQRAGGELPPGVARNFEADTYTCTHCTAVVILNPARVRERYKCKGCSHHLCDNCAAEMATGAECMTMAEKVDRHMEQVARQLEQSLIYLP